MRASAPAYQLMEMLATQRAGTAARPTEETKDTEHRNPQPYPQDLQLPGIGLECR